MTIPASQECLVKRGAATYLLALVSGRCLSIRGVGSQRPITKKGIEMTNLKTARWVALELAAPGRLGKTNHRAHQAANIINDLANEVEELKITRKEKGMADEAGSRESRLKRKARTVESEWKEWLEVDDQFPTVELLNAWDDLLVEILGRQAVITEADEEEAKGD